MCMSHSTLKHLLIILTLLVCTLSSAQASAATNGTEWHRYTSYDNVPVRIMDGENITWLLVRQNMYNNVSIFPEARLKPPISTPARKTLL